MASLHHPTGYREPFIDLTREEPTDSRFNVAQNNVKPLVIGISYGKVVRVSNEAITRSSVSDYDNLANDGYNTMIGIGDAFSTVNYTNEVDYEIDGTTNPDRIHWLDNTCSPPSVVASSDVSGGTLAAGDYDYAVTSENSHGETTISNIATVHLLATGKNLVSWVGVDEHATSEHVYRGASGGTLYLLKDISTKGTRSYIDDGTDVITSTEAPATNTCLRKPANAAEYFISYTYRDKSNIGNLGRYFNPSDGYADHDRTSQIGVCLDIMMSAYPTGQGCGEVLVIGLDEDDVASDELSAYQAALTTAENITEVINIVPCTYNDGVRAAVANHCAQMSNGENIKPRIATLGGSADDWGPADSTGTVMAHIAALTPNSSGGELIRYVANGGVDYKLYDETGSYTWVEKPAWPLCAAYAGRRAAIPDPSSGIAQSVIGYGKLRLTKTRGLDYTNRVQREYVGSVGALVFVYSNTPDANGVGHIQLVDDQTIYTISAYYNEASIVEIDLLLARYILTSLQERDLLGKKLTNSLKTQITSTIFDCETVYYIKNWILELGAVTLSAYALDPKRKVQVQYTYGPYFNLKGIYISRQFVYTTG